MPKNTVLTTTDADLITCIVPRGKADKVVRAALAGGADGATVFYGRGMGVREKLGLIGRLITPEKEVILIATRATMTDAIFEVLIEHARLREPGQGFAFVQKIEKSIGFLDMA